jgi:hypothetical protein
MRSYLDAYPTRDKASETSALPEIFPVEPLDLALDLGTPQNHSATVPGWDSNPITDLVSLVEGRDEPRRWIPDDAQASK